MKYNACWIFLNKRSQKSGLFLGKNSLITLRDLFRWAKRFADVDPEEKECDWKQYIAEQGLLLLGSRCRCEEDIRTIHACIEKVFKKKVDLDNLKDPKTLTRPIMKILDQVIFTVSYTIKLNIFNRTAISVIFGAKYIHIFILLVKID